jgi:threonine aldolase
MKILDFRSDTVTKPSRAMREAMFNAEVGDDVFGGDPTVNRLQDQIAELFEKEAALYVPSGTMANQICFKTHSRPGWELICDRQCHVVNYECAGPVVHSGLLVNMIETERGMISAETVRANFRAKTLHSPETKIVALENTHNHRGGTILPQDEIVRVKAVCDELGLIFHLDGARIWNVHVATGLSLAELVRPFESVSVCLSKGLGAPIGSCVLGSKAFVEEALRTRKLFGGAMRQVGVIAAAGIYAIEHNIKRLAEDHVNARFLAEQLNQLDLLDIDLSLVETNIILAHTTGHETSASMLEKMAQVGVLAVPFGPKTIRFVTHLDVNHDDCVELVKRVGKL